MYNYCVCHYFCVDEMNDYYTEFEEEVLEEDGEVVEYFGYDRPAVYVLVLSLQLLQLTL